LEPDVAEVLNASLLLRRGAGSRVGADRIALLEAIGESGSISAAARQVGLSYKGAWDAVQALNNLFEQPLVAARAGGRKGGEAEVTAQGEAVIAAFQLVEAELGQTLARLEQRLTHASAAPLSQLWSLGMKTSARNALKGVVSKVTDGAVNAEVTLKVSDALSIVAVLTRESVRSLALEPGAPAIALIKASSVILAPGAEAPVTSARNALKGRIVRREDGAVNSEITLEVDQGKTLTAIITRESAEDLDLKVGDPATALIKAPHVILAVE
jgi:molybdate transport system regulatory protein